MAKTEGVYNFDFENTWEIDKYCVNYPYPQLKSNPYIAVESIELLSSSNKLTYFLNETIDSSDVKLLVKYEDGTEAEVPLTSDMITADTSTPGIQNVTVNYRTGQTSFEIEVLPKGDVNGDGTVAISDVVAVSAYVSNAENNPLSETAIASADVHVTGNGLNANDAFMIQQYVTGIIENLN